MQSIRMDARAASDNLQVIRTLMERAAVYRRALAPLMIYVGTVGVLAALGGWSLRISSPTAFVGFWFCVGAIALTGAFLMVRRQAWQQAEAFWSPPTRRVAQAMLLPLTAGFILGALMIITDQLPTEIDPPTGGYPPERFTLVLLPLAWVILYGCAVHAAGFFVPKGMKLFGWLFVLGGFAALVIGLRMSDESLIGLGHAIMGFFFGGLHLACAAYLYFTERGKNAT
jgi:hypothetical protein